MRLALLDPKVQLAFKDPQEHKALQASQALVLLAHRALQDCKELLAHKDLQVAVAELLLPSHGL